MSSWRRSTYPPWASLHHCTGSAAPTSFGQCRVLGCLCHPSMRNTSCGSAIFVGWLLTFVAEVRPLKVPVSAGFRFAASSWLVLRLRSGSSRCETHSNRDTQFTARKSGLYNGTTPERCSLEKKVPKSCPEPLHVMLLPQLFPPSKKISSLKFLCLHIF